MRARGGVRRMLGVVALAAALALPGADLAAQASAEQGASAERNASVGPSASAERSSLLFPVRAGVSYVPVVEMSPGAPVGVVPAVGTRAADGSTERSVLRGAVIGALVGAAGGVAMGAWVCNQGFGCSDRALGITYWTLAGAGIGAVAGWVLHAVRAGD